MRVGSLFSGIGGLDLGLERAGMTVAWQAEINKQCREVLATKFPETHVFDDVKEIHAHPGLAVDVLCGGFPCQDLSVAGRRAGLAGERSGLFFEFMRIAAGLRPTWVIIENVPGLLSSDGGRDMGTVLGTLADIGYGWAYRVLDAQFFGVPQRRRRVFIVGCLGDPARAAAVLLEPEGLCGNPSPSKEARTRVTGTLASSSGSGGLGGAGQSASAITSRIVETAPTLQAGSNETGGVRPPGTTVDTCLSLIPETVSTLQGGGSRGYRMDAEAAAGGHVMATRAMTTKLHNTKSNQAGKWYEEYSPSLSASSPAPAVFNPYRTALKEGGWVEGWKPDQVHDALTAQAPPKGRPVTVDPSAVRRLTPLECERLQGFPDNWTEGLSDAARYRTLGNAVCVPVADWVGRRIMAVSDEYGPADEADWDAWLDLGGEG